MEHPEDDRPPCTPAPYHSAKGLELPDWNAGFKLSSPTFSRAAPARTPMRLGPPQRTPQAQKPTFKTPALPTFGRTPYTGGASVPRAPGLADLPNVTQADFWLNRASAHEKEGNFKAALEALETGIARRAAPTQALTRAISSLRAKMAKPADAPVKQRVAEVMETPAPANKAGGRDGRRTSHVRFCTPAPPAYVPLPTPSQTAGVNSCNAGSTPFFSGGRHSTMPDLAEADVPVGSPTTVSRKLLQPVLLDTIRTLRTRSALGLPASSAAANPGMTPGPAFRTPAPALAAGAPSHAAEVEAEGKRGKGAGIFSDVATETGISKPDALPEQDRFLMSSMVSPHTGALNVPAARPGSFEATPGANDTPCSAWSSGASTASIASHMRTCARAGDIDMHDTPACETVPGQQPVTAPLGTASKGTPSVLINPLYGNTPSTGSFDESCTPATVPCSTKRRETIFMTPSSSHGAAAPLMGTAGVRNLFFPAIDEESEGAEPDAEPPTARFAQLAVSGEQSQEEDTPAQDADAGEAVTQAAQHSTEASAAEAHADEDTVMRTAGTPDDSMAVVAVTSAAENADSECMDIQAVGQEESAELSPLGAELAIVAPEDVPRVAPRTPSSALRRRRTDIDENDAPTPLRNPLRIPTPARAKPPVGRHEMRGLFAGADAPNPAQLAAMGSRNALSPRRATALMRETLGHTTLLTPVRRSARKTSQAPASAGRMMAATGFAYAPNEALQARTAHLAAEGKLVLGDAQDPGIRACLHQVEAREESPVLLKGLPLSEIDPVKQLAEQLDACALEDPMTALIKAENTTPSGSFPGAFPPSSPSRNDGSPKIQEAVTPDIKRLTRSALKKAASASAQKKSRRGSREGSPSENSIRDGLRRSARVSTPKC